VAAEIIGMVRGTGRAVAGAEAAGLAEAVGVAAGADLEAEAVVAAERVEVGERLKGVGNRIGLVYCVLRLIIKRL